MVPFRGAPGARAAATCEHTALEIPRAILERHHAFTWNIGGECSQNVQLAACLRHRDGTLTPAEPLSRFQRTGPTCVAEGTAIAVRNGVQAVETLHDGSVVEAYDPTTHEQLLVTVHRVRAIENRSVAEFTLSNGQRLRATAEHLFYEAALDEFVEARGIHRGAMLLGENGSRVSVLSRTPFNRKVRVYDISVDGPHTYFASGVLVHNY